MAANLEMVKIVYYMDKDAKEAEEKKKVLAAFLKCRNKLWQHFMYISYDAKVCDSKDWSFFIFIDCDDVRRSFHTN